MPNKNVSLWKIVFYIRKKILNCFFFCYKLKIIYLFFFFKNRFGISIYFSYDCRKWNVDLIDLSGCLVDNWLICRDFSENFTIISPPTITKDNTENPLMISLFFRKIRTTVSRSHCLHLGMSSLHKRKPPNGIKILFTLKKSYKNIVWKLRTFPNHLNISAKINCWNENL